MALSVFQDPNGVDWPLGCVTVATPGTPVNFMSLVDPNNNNSPSTPTNKNSAETSPRCHKIQYQGYHASANNSGMQINSGNVYILRAPGPGNQNSGGPGNRSDSGAMVVVVYPGAGGTVLDMEMTGSTISPYRYALDADNAGDGLLLTAVGCSK